MKKKLLWKGTLKEMRSNVCYKYAIDEVLEIMDKYDFFATEKWDKMNNDYDEVELLEAMLKELKIELKNTLLRGKTK